MCTCARCNLTAFRGRRIACLGFIPSSWLHHVSKASDQAVVLCLLSSSYYPCRLAYRISWTEPQPKCVLSLIFKKIAKKNFTKRTPHRLDRTVKRQNSIILSSIIIEYSKLNRVMWTLWKFAAVCDHHGSSCFTTVTSIGFHLLHHVQTLFHCAEHHVFAVQPRREHSGDEKLGAIGIWSGVGHCISRFRNHDQLIEHAHNIWTDPFHR